MQVTFYKTSLTPLQRMYDKTAYESYFASSYVTATTIEVNNLIVENYDFFISAETYNTNKLNLYNYIKWINNGITYCAFITKISYLANNKAYRVSHALDSWAFACYNTNFNILGKCSRAHVNDRIGTVMYNTQLYTLENTFNSCEESFNTSELEIEKHDISNMKNTLFDKTQYKDIHFIYVYINNPEALKIVAPQRLERMSSSGNAVDSIYLTGALLCGTINMKTGECFFKIFSSNFDGNIMPRDFTLICELTSQYITSIFISDIPPVELGNKLELKHYGAYYVFQEKESIRTYDYSLDFGSGLNTNCSFIHSLNLEINYNGTQEFYDYRKQIYYNPFIDKVNNYNLDRYSIYITNDFELYLKYGIAKARSHVYNPFYFNDYQIDFVHFQELKIGLSPEGSFIWYDSNADNRNVYSAKGSYAYTMSFAPDTVRDYWTTISAERATISAQKTANNAEWNYSRFMVNGIFGLTSDGLNLAGDTVSSAGGIVEDLAEGNVAGAVGTGLNNAANQVRYIGKVVNFGMEAKQRNTDLKYQRKISNIDIEQANQQKIAGITTNYTSTSYYAYYYYLQCPVLTTVKLGENNLRQVSYKLHKYGYNTFLTLEEVYSNHRREKFNFISTSECEVLNVPLTIANDIVNMFNNGVFLWSNNDVGNFNQTNYQGVVENV